jgi:dolichyl-phosphate-mannose-protein mannosyltransferase
MRIFNGVFGALMVPLAYYTAIQLRLSRPAAIFMSILVICGMLYFIHKKNRHGFMRY